MTKEEKELLLKDLCARIPYHTLVQLNPGAYNKPETCLLTGVHGEKVHLNVDSDPFRVDNIKPYLRPMYSMTEEERKEYKHLIAFSGSSSGTADLVDWLNKKMFAYRTIDGKDMFKLNLALEAPKDMYKTE